MTERITRQKVAPTKRLLALGLTVTLSFSAICGWVLWHAGDRDYLHSRAAAANLVSSLASEIDRNIELYDLSLQAAVDGMKLPDINRISRELKQVVLFDRAATAKDMGAILVIDRLGRVVMDSRSPVPAEANYSGYDFFQVHAGRPDAGLFISRPWIGVAAMIPQVGLTPSDLIKSADLALYEAKRSGRNRTVAAPTMASADRVAA